MWSAPASRISRTNIQREHLRILEHAVAECADSDVCTAEVYEALDYLQRDANRTWGFAVFRRGLECKSEAGIAEGLSLIIKHLGLAGDAKR